MDPNKLQSLSLHRTLCWAYRAGDLSPLFRIFPPSIVSSTCCINVDSLGNDPGSISGSSPVIMQLFGHHFIELYFRIEFWTLRSSQWISLFGNHIPLKRQFTFRDFWGFIVSQIWVHFLVNTYSTLVRHLFVYRILIDLGLHSGTQAPETCDPKQAMPKRLPCTWPRFSILLLPSPQGPGAEHLP